MPGAPRIAFVTCASVGGFAPDDRGTVASLERRGAVVDAAFWTNPAVDWAVFDAVVMRSTWDYHLDPGHFAAWIDELERAGARLWNPPAMVRWNAHKSYLVELEAAGVPVIETILVPPERPLGLREAMESFGAGALVAKPAVGGTAYRTERITADEAAQTEARLATSRDRDWILQPFLPEIETAGEWSLTFLGRAFSHAVVKRPAAGDYRVHSEYGGSTDAASPSDAILAAAEAALAAAAGEALYARVDLVETPRGPLLMELELIEPMLFLDWDGASAGRFADVILATVGS